MDTRTAVVTAETLRLVLPQCVGPDSTVAPVRVRGVAAHAVLTVVPDEHLRRRRLGGVPACEDLQALDVLLSLPAGLDVPLSVLTPVERRRLRRCPPHMVRTAAGRSVLRLGVVPAAVSLMLVCGERLSACLLRAAGRFGAYTSTAVLVGSPPRDDDLMVQADWYGVGVLQAREDPPVLWLPPRPFVPASHSASGWRFAEQVYTQAVLTGAVASSPSTPARAEA
jgi:hypothetical protein